MSRLHATTSAVNNASFAAIDSGSNTFRLLIAEPSDGDVPWQRIDYAHAITRLGEGLHHSGRLGEAGMTRAIEAYKGFAEVLAKHGIPAAHTFAAATAAMREAENGAEFCARVKDETGIEIQVISGIEEARMSLAGACAVLHPETRHDMLLFDIGGGSTEFVRARDDERIDDISRKLGVVRLVEVHLHSDPPSAEDYAALKAAADAHLVDVEGFWKDGKPPSHLVGTAGTVTTLAATVLDLCPYEPEPINNFSMSRKTFEDLRDHLLSLTHDDRLNIRTIEAGRSDLIIAGLAIIEAVMDRWHYDALISVDAGLLEGLWLEISKSD